MSFSHTGRGTFSLSNSNESPRQKSPELSSKFVNNNSVNSLGFLLQAASNNNSNNAMGPTDQQQGAKPSDMDQQAMELQQALQMSMASQNQQAAHPSALFATNRPANSSAPTAAAAQAQATAQIVTQLQAQQLLAGATGGQVNQQVFAPQAASIAGAAAVASQAPSAPGNNNANVINQLVASLQAQQQAQQQVQVQAAIARAFGPGGGGGLSAAGFNNNPMVNLAGMASSISQPSARDILSRMQLVQAVQQDNSNNAASNGNANDDLVKLQQAQQSGELFYWGRGFLFISSHCNVSFSHTLLYFFLPIYSQLRLMISLMDSRPSVSFLHKLLPFRTMSLLA